MKTIRKGVEVIIAALVMLFTISMTPEAVEAFPTPAHVQGVEGYAVVCNGPEGTNEGGGKEFEIVCTSMENIGMAKEPIAGGLDPVYVVSVMFGEEDFHDRTMPKNDRPLGRTSDGTINGEEWPGWRHTDKYMEAMEQTAPDDCCEIHDDARGGLQHTNKDAAVLKGMEEIVDGTHTTRPFVTGQAYGENEEN